MDGQPAGTLRIARALISNAFIFFLVSALILIVLFAAGNVQLFTEATVFMLLRLLYWNGIMLFAFAVLSILFGSVFALFYGELRRLSQLAVYALFAAAGLVLTLFAGGILVLSKGNEL